MKNEEKRNKKKGHGGIVILWILGVILILVALFIALTVHKELRITLNGEPQIEVSYGKPYEDPGARAVWGNRFFSFLGGEAEVVADTGSVDTSVLGTYEVYYTSVYKNVTATAVREVKVVDDEAPVITLNSKKDYYTLPGQPYVDEGYTAVDNHDGDVTAKVMAVEKDGKVHYTVTDASGNTGTATREIFYDDREAPVITLSGLDFVVAGKEWTGSFTATDNAEGDIMDKVQITGAVDTQTPGTYELTYVAVDAYNNRTEVKRTVTVTDGNAGSQPWGEPVTGSKIVFLTFDDGPGPYTAEILDILAKYKVPATFFVTDQFDEYKDLIAREAKEGHTVAVHTYSHDYETLYASEEAYWDDFTKMNDLIEEQTGTRSDIFRFPGGSSNEISYQYNIGIMTALTAAASDIGLDYYDWNVDSNDAGGAETADEVAANVIEGIQNTDISVVLMHDIHEYTKDALEQIIKYGQENGYTFMNIYKGCFNCHHTVNN